MTAIKNDMEKKWESVNKVITSIQEQRPVTNTIIERTVAVPQTNTENVSTQNRNVTFKKPNISYAEALSKSDTPIEAISTINIKLTEDDEIKALNKQLRSDNVCAEHSIRDIIVRNDKTILLKCKDKETADAIDVTLSNKYKDAIEIKAVAPTMPEIKIAKLYTTLDSPEEILQQIQEQNEWFRTLCVNIVSLDTVLSRRGEYKNINMSTDHDTFKIIISKRKIFFGFSTSPIYENASVRSMLALWTLHQRMQK